MAFGAANEYLLEEWQCETNGLADIWIYALNERIESAVLVIQAILCAWLYTFLVVLTLCALIARGVEEDKERLVQKRARAFKVTISPLWVTRECSIQPSTILTSDEDTDDLDTDDDNDFGETDESTDPEFVQAITRSSSFEELQSTTRTPQPQLAMNTPVNSQTKVEPASNVEQAEEKDKVEDLTSGQKEGSDSLQKEVTSSKEDLVTLKDDLNELEDMMSSFRKTLRDAKAAAAK